MGLWATGYMEFHERTGLDEDYFPSKPMLQRCPQCEKEFSNAEALSHHRFEAHPYLQPVLVINGMELIGRRHTISKEIRAKNISCTNTSECWINEKSVTNGELSKRIASVRQGFVTVVLKNNLGQVTTTYELDIAIPELVDIIDVDKRFFEFSSVGKLSAMSVNDFIQVTRNFHSARTYVDGLSSYLYGVLAKDQRGDITLSREQGRARMTYALQLLSLFDTSLSKVIVQVINFNLNAFNDGDAVKNSPRLANGTNRFWRLLHSNEKSSLVSIQLDHSTAKQFPLDICTSQLLEWSSFSAADIVERRKELEKVFSDDNWVPDDRLKVHILLADVLQKQGDLPSAIEHARRLRHDSFWGEWAEILIQKNS